MSKIKKQFVCTNCGVVSPKWSGQCFDCNSWGTIAEEIVQQSTNALDMKKVNIERFDDQIDEIERIPTSISELDRVLGGGFVDGSVTLIGGDPGIGKSTLLLQLVAIMSKQLRCAYVTGEESSEQIKLRAKRLGYAGCASALVAASNIDSIILTLLDDTKNFEKKFDLVVIDSIQTMYSSEAGATPGSVTQIKLCTQALVNFAKQNNIIVVIVGHVTKDGQLAGPKLLEHMVDTVLYFEGDQYHHYRILRSVKNRFGAVNEIGVFEMSSNGLSEVVNPSEAFLMRRENNLSGTCVFAGIEGSRPLLVEIQALIAPSNMPMPKRSVVGWDSNRLAMILAVLCVRFGLNLSDKEVYLSVAGGLKLTEPGVDLAVCAALISAAYNIALPEASVFFGEVGLSGEIRKISQGELRLKESVKQGYKSVYSAPFVMIDTNNSTNEEKSKHGHHEIFHIKQLKNILNIKK